VDNIVVVGGGAAGLAAVETLRAEGFTGSLTLVCGEPELPYDRPPLSKQVLIGTWDPDRARFREAPHYAQLKVRLVHGLARSLDAAGRAVELSDGYRLRYDGLIIATGVRPRLLPASPGSSPHDLAGVHVLRGLANVAALRESFAAATSGGSGRLVIVGAGFLGMEVAAAARGMGLHTTVVDPLPEPMIRQVGPLVGAAVAALHRGHGVDVRTGTGVTGLAGDNGIVTGVTLDDGSTLPADCVLVAIGAVPETEWLAGSGLGLGDGVECDAYLRAAPGVYAAGDVASWPSPRYRRRVRVEHRMNATEMGTTAARNLLSEADGAPPAPFDPLPYFWSDQYTAKLQVHGELSADCTPTIEEGEVGSGRFVALFRREGAPSAVLGWSAASRMPAYRKLLLG
jgi:NADPH-dependent 2,4-dienoyl-CoA reductase/sulfur reductase-like enzyme